MANILLAEDEDNIRDGLKVALELEGHTVHAVANGIDAVAAFDRARPDLLLLDVMMPRMTGFEVCVHVRNVDAAVPILMLTAKNEESDTVFGLGLGADDYLTKPVRMQELQARIGAALRRARVASPAARPVAETYVFGRWTFDAGNHLLLEDGTRRVPLTPVQTSLMKLFVRNPDCLFSRERLFEVGWGGLRVGSFRLVDQQIAKLRRKLGTAGVCVETVFGCGYRFRKAV